MNDETAATETEAPASAPIQILAVPRLGNVQLLLTYEGEGIERAVYAKISRVCVEKGRENVWSMEDLLALSVLAERATTYAMEAQTMIVKGAPDA